MNKFKTFTYHRSTANNTSNRPSLCTIMTNHILARIATFVLRTFIKATTTILHLRFTAHNNLIFVSSILKYFFLCRCSQSQLSRNECIKRWESSPTYCRFVCNTNWVSVHVQIRLANLVIHINSVVSQGVTITNVNQIAWNPINQKPRNQNVRIKIDRKIDDCSISGFLIDDHILSAFLLVNMETKIYNRHIQL